MDRILADNLWDLYVCDDEKETSYRYLAGYRRGSRVAGEKRFGGRQKMRYHMADKAGRMYWCDCFQGWRSDGRIKYAGTGCGKHIGKQL